MTSGKEKQENMDVKKKMETDVGETKKTPTLKYESKD